MIKTIPSSNKRFKVFLLLFGLTVLSSITFSLLTLTIATLAIFEEDGEQYEYTMLECTSCPAIYEGTSYSCLKSRECRDGNESLCSTGKALTYGKWSLFITELLSLICSVLAFWKLVHIYLGLDLDRPLELYVCVCVLFLSKIIGLILFISLGKVKLPIICSDSDVCTGFGGVLVSLNSALGFLIMICGLIQHKFQRNTSVLEVHQSENMRPHIMKTLGCFILSLALWFTAQFLNWFSYEDSQTRKGSLVSLDKYEIYKDMEHSCISAVKCYSKDERDCNAFRKLSDAFVAYYYIEIACVLIFCSWLENLIQIALKRRVFIKSLSLCLAWLGSTGNIVSLVTWMGISEVSFDTDCEISLTDTELSFCADIGLMIALVGAFSFILSATYYTIILVNLDRKFVSPSRMPTFSKRMNYTARIPALEDKEETDDTNTDFFSQHNKTAEENFCKSCNSYYMSTQVRVTNCGHTVHIKCRKRTDGHLICRNCPISN